MRRAGTWILTLVVSLAALVGLIALINSRDQSGVSPKQTAPGQPYTGEPVLSPGLQDAIRKGNVVVLYRDASPPPGTRALVPPGGKQLEQAGQSVVIDREPTLKSPLAAVSGRRIQGADTPGQLQPFIDYWLGSG